MSQPTTPKFGWMTKLRPREALRSLLSRGSAETIGEHASFTVKFKNGKIVFPGGFQLKYTVPSEKDCFIWKTDASNRSNFHFSVLQSQSGSGKTSFLRCLYDRLVMVVNTEQFTNKLAWDFSPDFENGFRAGVGFIPQHVPMVNHWTTREILPDDPMFFNCFDFNANQSFLSKRIGELSGGERRRLYTCSAVERLARRNDQTAFLLLDETFDGLGADDLTQCMDRLKDCWSCKDLRPLHVLLITHHKVSSSEKLIIKMKVLKRSSESLCIQVENDS